ncbi:hypothetical protein GCM10022251_81990 [Phytohabitans flavus]|uniref:Uncharacterized protein n=1 Tax=Phytohabitans flavus TaxID=1076124 RepID=A0A6F8XV78_9ACTN|nr:hypothetical protein [Phytohabitans flavus]BCB77720.1 hypothetical protein Pflav_041300 [Phytohabitans flavus]
MKITVHKRDTVAGPRASSDGPGEGLCAVPVPIGGGCGSGSGSSVGLHLTAPGGETKAPAAPLSGR